MQTAIAQYFKKMKDFDLKGYLAENKLVKEEQESITIDSEVDFETPLKTLENSVAEPNLEEADAIREFIDFINRKYPNLTYNQIHQYKHNGYKGNLLRDATEEFEEEVETPYTTQSAVNNYIDEVYGFIRELNLDFPEELKEIDMTISSEAVESSVKQGLNQMFERLADVVDDKDDIQSETLGVTNYIKRLMREYAKYADMDRQDLIEGGNKFSKQGKEEARQEIERILSMK